MNFFFVFLLIFDQIIYILRESLVTNFSFCFRFMISNSVVCLTERNAFLVWSWRVSDIQILKPYWIQKIFEIYIPWILIVYTFVLEELYISEFTNMWYESFIKYILFINCIWTYIHSSIYNTINMKYIIKSHILTEYKTDINIEYTFIIIIYNVNIKKSDIFIDFLKFSKKLIFGWKNCLFNVYLRWI